MQSKEKPDETLLAISKRRPALASILNVFAPIFEKQDAVSETLIPIFREKGIELPSFSASRLSLGVSLLSGSPLPDISFAYELAFEELAPLLKTLPALSKKMKALAPLFKKKAAENQELFLRACTQNDACPLEAIAHDHKVEPQVLGFLLDFIVPTLLRPLVSMAYGETTGPWDENSLWQQGYCPVCGSYPTIAWLDKPVIDERNTYLHEGGGRRHLFCGVCGASWRFLRLGCPACGGNKSKQLEILAEENNAYGESLSWCVDCRSYCPTVDLRERVQRPDMNAQSFGMLHLDIIAAEKKLHPLRRSFWNTFPESEENQKA
ncbi:MAG: formate dehydrogenase accessory protein FdhE [Desulfovibrio sp.]|nr:formate dehydrogenase accessory protein FdhE [Desulfovibrio sp.]